ncbi:MAG TPA: M48 family metallopeptidase [Vicinamibacterales bacterium]|nr:M48 family metallopeptidase [Vicinamibacterales bacterium]
MRRTRAGAAVLALVLAVPVLAGQAQITPPPNKYTPAQDVQIGEKAAAEVEQQLPILHNDAITAYVAGVGERLVAAIPAPLRHPEFHYTFQVVDVSEINAFALPGGPMFINRGMIEKAHTEGEIAGVMAHEMSHVVLRHGTAQATKATKYEVGQVLGAVVGAIIGGNVGNVVAQGTQFGLGAAFLRFSREDEKQADLLGTHIMARAGYDPRDMANVFKTIEQESGPGGPQWLSDHPNPGDRYEYINEEANLLHVDATNEVHDTAQFEQVQAKLEAMPPAPTTEQATRNAAARGASGEGTSAAGLGRVAAPSKTWKTYNEGDVFQVAVPSNWRELPGNNSVTFAPEGGYGTAGQSGVFTHGVQIGIARNENDDLETATGELIQSLARTNPRLSRAGDPAQTSIGGVTALRTTLANVSDATGEQEQIALFTAGLSDGSLFYVIGVAPRSQFARYTTVFDRVAQSIHFTR